MINRSTFPHASASESSHDDSPGASEPLFTLRSARKWFQLPSSLQGYLIFLLCLLILAFTMVLHVTLSAEILRLNVDLDNLVAENDRIERHNANLVWLISQRSSLTDAFKTAQELEYAPVTEVRYVVRTGEEPILAGVEPIVSQFESQIEGKPPWWQRAWDRMQGSYERAQRWVWVRLGW